MALSKLARSPKVSRKAQSKITGATLSVTTAWHRKHGRISREQKARDQQKLTQIEEKVLADAWMTYHEKGYALQKEVFREVSRYVIGLKRDVRVNEPSNKWIQGFLKRHAHLRKAKAKFAGRFRKGTALINKQTMIDFILDRLDPNETKIRDENIYQVAITAVLLDSFPLDIEKLVAVDGILDCTELNTTKMITAVECVSKTGQSLEPYVLWPSDSCPQSMTAFPGGLWNHATYQRGYFDKGSREKWFRETFDCATSEKAFPGPRILLVDAVHRFGDTIDFCSEKNIRLIDAGSANGRSFWTPQIIMQKILKAFGKATEVIHGRENRDLGVKDFNAIYHSARAMAMSDLPKLSCMEIPRQDTGHSTSVLAELEGNLEVESAVQASNHATTWLGVSKAELGGPSMESIISDPAFRRLATRTKNDIRQLAVLAAESVQQRCARVEYHG